VLAVLVSEAVRGTSTRIGHRLQGQGGHQAFAHCAICTLASFEATPGHEAFPSRKTKVDLKLTTADDNDLQALRLSRRNDPTRHPGLEEADDGSRLEDRLLALSVVDP
jgi:hypothetical protein